jgi:hypothetical protein
MRIIVQKEGYVVYVLDISCRTYSPARQSSPSKLYICRDNWNGRLGRFGVLPDHTWRRLEETGILQYISHCVSPISLSLCFLLFHRFNHRFTLAGGPPLPSAKVSWAQSSNTWRCHGQGTPSVVLFSCETESDFVYWFGVRAFERSNKDLRVESRENLIFRV